MSNQLAQNDLVEQRKRAQARILQIGDEIDAIGKLAAEESRDLSDDDMAGIQQRNDEFDKLTETVQRLDKTISLRDKITAGRITTEALQSDHNSLVNQSAKKAIPARLARVKSKYFQSNLDAYAAGMWIGAALLKRPDCRQWLDQHAPDPSFRQAMEGGTDTLGGYTVPDPLAATIIELVESWGVFRQYARNVAMTSDTLRVPKLDAGMTVYYPDEGDPITASDLTFDQVSLAAKKYAALGVLSTELAEDSVISVVDLTVRDIARRFSYAEDLNSFLGDGSASFGNITGIASALQAGAKVNVAGGALSGVTLADYNSALAKLPMYAGLTPAYFMSRYTYYESVIPLLQAAGGTDQRQIEEGGMGRLNGIPVVFTQVLPGQAATTGDMFAVCGDLDLGCYLGTRRQVSIRTLDQTFAVNDQLGVMGTMRADSVTHDVGDATTAGAVVGMFLTV